MTKKTYRLRALTVMGAMVLAASLLVLVGATKPAEASFPGPNGKIAFVSSRDGDAEIYTMNPDGSNQTRLTNNSATEFGPAFSPGGIKIAFTRDSEVFVMNADGSGTQTNIFNSPSDFDYDPAFSPNGTRIAFVSTRDSGEGVDNPTGDPEIFTVNPDGTGLTQLTKNSTNDTNPVFSPDGTKIAFERDVGDREIYVMNADGSNQTNLTDNLVNDVEPAFSPDGYKIAFSSRRTAGPGVDNPEGDDEIFTMNLDDSSLSQLTKNSLSDSDPAFSPDGTKLAYSRPQPGTTSDEVYVIDANGSNGTNISNSSLAFDGDVDWGAQTVSPPQTPKHKPKHKKKHKKKRH